MGKFTWEGWQTSVSDAPQPTSILYGANLRKSLNENSQKTQQKPQPEALESEIRNLENNLFQQMVQVQQPMQPELPQPGPTQGESPSPTQSSMELAAAAMRLKLQQNRKALQEQGIQSVSDKIKQRNEQQKP
jgi:hypothetical protein